MYDVTMYGVTTYKMTMYDVEIYNVTMYDVTHILVLGATVGPSEPGPGFVPVGARGWDPLGHQTALSGLVLHSGRGQGSDIDKVDIDK